MSSERSVRDVSGLYTGKLVEPMGFEPTTSSMPSRRAPNCATAPPKECLSLSQHAKERVAAAIIFQDRQSRLVSADGLPPLSPELQTELENSSLSNNRYLLSPEMVIQHTD